MNPKIPALTDLFAFFTTTQAERRSVTAQGRDVTAPHLPRLLLGSTQAEEHTCLRELVYREGGGRKENILRFICKIRVWVFFFSFYFLSLSHSLASAPLSGQRRRPLVRGLTISSSEDAARLPRRRQDPLFSDPRSGRPG